MFVLRSDMQDLLTMNQSAPPPFSAESRIVSTSSLSFVASDTEDAQRALASLSNRYGNVDADDADIIVALGGDGLMLQTLHAHMESCKPIYGMNRGSVGFLMNEYREDNLPDRLAKADVTTIRPLELTAADEHGNEHMALAINEVSLLRQTSQAARLRISVDEKVRLEELVCDGIIVATPARQHRLQSVRPRADLADHGTVARTDADQCLSPEAMARRASAERSESGHRDPRSRQAPRERLCRSHGNPPRDTCIRQGIVPGERRDHVRFRPWMGRTHSVGNVPVLNVCSEKHVLATAC